MGSRECRKEGDPFAPPESGSARDDFNVLNEFNGWGNLPVMPLGNLHNSVLPIIFCDGSRDKTGGKEAGLPA